MELHARAAGPAGDESVSVYSEVPFAKLGEMFLTCILGHFGGKPPCYVCFHQHVLHHASAISLPKQGGMIIGSEIWGV